MSRNFSIVHRVFLVTLGVSLLVLTFPHTSPVDMTNFAREVHGSALFFAIKPPLATNPIFLTTTEVVLVMLVFVLLAITAIFHSTLRSAWKSLLTRKRALIGGMIATEVLIITLLPSELYFVTKGPLVVLYLFIASFGLVFLFAGTFPLLRNISAGNWFSSFIETLYGLLRRAVLDSSRLKFLTILALLEFLLASLISHFVLDGVPHIQDSIAQLFHAKIVASGYLTAPSPPLREFFDYLTMINDGQWYSQYPPGHTLLLALGVILGVPWAINPLLGSLIIVAVYLLGKEFYGEVIGRLSALLTFFSPFILFMSSEFMNHSSSLFFTTVFVLFFVKSLRTGQFVHGLIAGAALGWVACIRPYTAAAIAVPVLLYGLIQFFRRSRELKKPALGFVSSGLVFLALLLSFNYATTGDALLFGYEKLWGSQVGVGFGKGPWVEPHTPMTGLRQTLSNLNGINKYLFEWPAPSLLFVVFLFFTGTTNRWDVLLVSIFAALSIFYFFYWFQDWCFGPRYLYEASSALIILTARGIEQIPVVWRDVLGFATARNTIRITSVWILLLMFGLGLATNIPPHIESYGNSYWDVSGEILKTVEERGIDRAVVFVRGGYENGFIGNEPFLRNAVIYVRDLGERNKEMMNLYPSYEYYLAAEGRLDQLPALSE